ncbi:MAG: GntR family transcriptional regulator [Heyndrickxia sp.]
MIFDRSNPSWDHPEFGESLPQQIYKHILKNIIEGKIKAGEKIVEEDVSKELNTSRAPVREALYLLQVDGIVERIPRRGTVVRTFSQHEIVEYNDVTIELLRVAVDYSRDKWKEENKSTLKTYIQELNNEFENKNVIPYQIKAQQLLKYLLIIADNKALTRFYDEASHILKVFAQTQWNIKTVENFHANFHIFAESILHSDFDKAKEAIYHALKQGVIRGE